MSRCSSSRLWLRVGTLVSTWARKDAVGTSAGLRSSMAKYKLRWRMPPVAAWCNSSGISPTCSQARGSGLGSRSIWESFRRGRAASAAALSGVCCQASTARCSLRSVSRSALVHLAAAWARRCASAASRSCPRVWEGVSSTRQVWGFWSSSSSSSDSK